MYYLNGENTIVIYSENELDSFLGYWVIKKHLNNSHGCHDIQLLAQHDLKNHVVYLMGLPENIQEYIPYLKNAFKVYIFEHHCSFYMQITQLQTLLPNLEIKFSNHSISMNTWNFFAQDLPPNLLYWVEDRVLWKFSIPNSYQVFTALNSYPFDLSVVDYLMYQKNIHELIKEGEILVRKINQDVNQLLTQKLNKINLEGFEVPFININPLLSHEVGIRLSKNEPFSVCYWDKPNGRYLKLISNDYGIDLTPIAIKYNGRGGRYEASLFIPKNHPLMQLN